MNLSNVYDYLGIDRACYCTPYKNIEFGKGIWGLTTPTEQKTNPHLAKLGNTGIVFKRIMHTHKMDMVYFWFSYSRIFNGINLSSLTPIDRIIPNRAFIHLTEQNGIRFKSSMDIWLSSIEIFRNISLEKPYSEYVDIFRTMSFRMAKQFSYKDTVYLRNGQFELKCYDKAQEIFKKHGIQLDANTARIELKLRRKRKIDNVVSAFDLKEHGIGDDEEEGYFGYRYDLIFHDHFYKTIERAFKDLMNFTFTPETSNLLQELVRYYKLKKRKNPKKVALEAWEYFTLRQLDKLSQYLENMVKEVKKSAIKPNEAKGKIQRRRKKINELLSDAMLIDYTIQHGTGMITEFVSKLISDKKPLLLEWPDSNQVA